MQFVDKPSKIATFFLLPRENDSFRSSTINWRLSWQQFYALVCKANSGNAWKETPKYKCASRPQRLFWKLLRTFSWTYLISGIPWSGTVTTDFLEFPDRDCVEACERNGFAVTQQTTYVRKWDSSCGRGTCQKLLSRFFPLRGGGYPQFR